MSTPSKPVFALALLIVAFTVAIGWAAPHAVGQAVGHASHTHESLAGITNAATHDIIERGTLPYMEMYGGRSAARIKPPGEQIVIWGLNWLQQNQNEDGSWGGGSNEYRAATGLAVLAFMGHGETADSLKYGVTILKGLKWLVGDMQATNGLVRMGRLAAIEHAISTLAVSEGFLLTHRLPLTLAVESGVAVILNGQRDSGLWDASYRRDGGSDDMEASVWQVLALKSRLKMGYRVDGLAESLLKASAAMEKILADKPAPDTAIGAVLCLQLCGQSGKPVCRTALDGLDAITPDWDRPGFKDPIFRWQLATQTFFNEGRDHWARWNRLFMPMLVTHQVTQKVEHSEFSGFWDSPGPDERFGRIGATSLSLLMLEVYQSSHLPVFDPMPLTNGAAAADKDSEVRIR